MGELNEFRLSYETSFLFVLSHEYDIALAKLLSMYALSDKIFWAYMSLLAPMSKMGVRKSNQLAKVANRLYKKIRNLQDKYKRKIEEDEYDEDGNIVLDENNTITIAHINLNNGNIIITENTQTGNIYRIPIKTNKLYISSKDENNEL